MESALLDDSAVSAMLASLVSLLTPRASVVGRAVLPVRLQSDYGRGAADDVLAARDLEDLGDRLIALASDEQFWLSEVSPLQARKPFVAAETISLVDGMKLDTESLSRVLGPTVAQRCQDGHNALKEALRRLIAIVAAVNMRRNETPAEEAMARENRAAEIAQRAVRNPIEFAYDVTLPPTVRNLLFAFLRHFAATIAIGRAEERGERLDAWLALGLATAWSEGPTKLLATLASVESVAAWFVQVTSEMATVEATGSLFSRWRAEAEASGQPIFFPLDDADRETH